MAKFFMKSGVFLMGVMLVLALGSCKDSGGNKPSLSKAAVLNDFQASTAELVKDGVLGEAISKQDWDALDDSTYLTELQKGVLDFNNEVTSAAVTFNANASSGAEVTYAVVKGVAFPTTFSTITVTSPELATNDAIYFRVVSEDRSVTNYYCVIVTGLGDSPSNSTGISGVKIGAGESRSPSAAQGNANIGSVQPIVYVLPSANMTGAVNLELDRNNAAQKISWSVGDTTTFTDFDEPTSGNTLSAAISTAGLADESIIYIKVVAADLVSTLYYAFKIDIGNIAEIDTLSIGGVAVVNFGTPGSDWNVGVTAADFDYQLDTPAEGFILAAAAKDGGKIEYAVTNSLTAAPAFTALSGTPVIDIGNGSFLYIKVTSINDNKTVFYRIRTLMKTTMTILYGQPEIKLGVNGEAPELDPLWDTLTEWMGDVNRVNMNEMAPVFKFLNTVDGHYDVTGYGHTEGKVKAFWDDGGLYIYAQMDFRDYFETAASGTPTVRNTVLTPAATGTGSVADDSAHNYDSLEIFTNERVQSYTEGSYGIQYRVAPSTAGESVTGTNSRISGNPPATLAGPAASAINVLKNSGNYYTWIRKDNNGKEEGYSIIAYIPWMFKNNAEANAVFADGKVKTTGNETGPTVGVEFQLNTGTVGGARDAILTWNGVTGQSYNQVRNYGKAHLITGNLAARGINRGERDPLPVTVTFNTDGGTGTFNPIVVDKGFAAGSLFPADHPTKDGFIFGGWFDESVTPHRRYTENTSIIDDVTLTARWNVDAGLGIEIWSLASYIAANNYPENYVFTSSSSVSAKPFRPSSSSCPAVIKGGGVELTAMTANHHGFNLWVHGRSSGDLNLYDANGNARAVYEITVTGSIVAGTNISGAAIDGETVRIASEQGSHPGFNDPDDNFISGPLSLENPTFTIGGILPAEWNPADFGSSNPNNEVIRIRSSTGVLFRIDSITIYEKPEGAAESVIYELWEDDTLGTLNGNGGGTSHYLFHRVGGPDTVMTVNTTAQTITSIGRTGTSHGLQLSLAKFASITKPGYTYVLEYWGVFGAGASQGRFRLESGTNPSASNPVGSPPATSNVLALSTENIAADSVDRSFYVKWALTKEELDSLGATAFISFANTSGNIDITYTNIVITEIAP